MIERLCYTAGTETQQRVNMKLFTTLILAASAVISGCSSDANVASYNISKAADQFEINRRVIFYNGITGEYILAIEGYCSLGNSDKAGQLSVTCKTGPSDFKKHFLGLSDNVTYFAEQIEPAKASVYHYKTSSDHFIFKRSHL